MSIAKNWLWLSAGLLLTVQLSCLSAERECKPDRWAEAMEKFRAADQRERPPRNAILFVGSSSIRLWDLPKYFPKAAVINRGFGGSEVADSIYYAERIVIKYQPRIVVMYAGDNDIARGKSDERVAADFRTFVDKVHTALPDTKVIYVSIKPSIARWKYAETMHSANDRVSGLCERDDLLEFVDIWTPMLNEANGPPRQKWFVEDGLHLSDEGYQLWASLVAPHLVTP